MLLDSLNVDPGIFIRTDGTSTCTASIGFAEGLSIPSNKKILLGNSSTYIWVEPGSGSIYFTSDVGANWPNLNFQVSDPSGYVRFTAGSSDTTYDSSGITHSIQTGDGFTITDHLFGEALTFFSYPHPTTPYSQFFRDLYIQPSDPSYESATLFQIKVSSGGGGAVLFNANTLSPQLNIGAKTNIAITNTNAFLVENASGTDRFLVDTSTPKIDLLANNNFGVAGTGYDSTWYTGTSGKELNWRPAASGANPIFSYVGQTGKTQHIKVSLTETSTVSAQSVVAMPITFTTSGASNIAALFDIDLTDSRTISSGGTEAKNVLDFAISRSSFTSSIQGHILRGALYTLTDSGTYSRTAGISNTFFGNSYTWGATPTISASSGSGTYEATTIRVDGSIFGNNSFTTFSAYAYDYQPALTLLAGVMNIAGFRYAPNVTIAGGSSTEYAIYASRSGVGLIADGSSATVGSSGGAGGGLIMGASSDSQRYYESADHLVENIPTGADFNWRINHVNQTKLALRTLTLGDNTSNDFTINFDQTNDATIRWDNADQTYYIQTNGASEFVYPTYGAGVVIDVAVPDTAIKYALQAWATTQSGTPTTAGGFWGGYQDSSGSASPAEVYGGTFYNYFASTSARSITSVTGNYVGNEIVAGSQLTLGTLRGIYIGVQDSAVGTLATVADVISLDITKPTIVVTGTTPTNSYYIKTGAANTFATNNYGFFLGGASNLTFRAGTQAIWSSAASTLDLTSNTTYNFKFGANPANGTAGTTVGVYTVNSGFTHTYSADFGLAGAWRGASFAVTQTRATSGGSGTGVNISLTTAQTNGTHNLLPMSFSATAMTSGQARGGFITLQNTASETPGLVGYSIGFGKGTTASTPGGANGEIRFLITDIKALTTGGASYLIKATRSGGAGTYPATAYTIQGWGHYDLLDNNLWDIASSTNACRSGYFGTSLFAGTTTSGGRVNIGVSGSSNPGIKFTIGSSTREPLFNTVSGGFGWELFAENSANGDLFLRTNNATDRYRFYRDSNRFRIGSNPSSTLASEALSVDGLVQVYKGASFNTGGGSTDPDNFFKVFKSDGTAGALHLNPSTGTSGGVGFFTTTLSGILNFQSGLVSTPKAGLAVTLQSATDNLTEWWSADVFSSSAFGWGAISDNSANGDRLIFAKNGTSTNSTAIYLKRSNQNVGIGNAWTISGTQPAYPLDVNGKIHTDGEIEIDGALNHDGTTVGFYGVTPTARPSAYTQTYSTATRTHANVTSANLSTTAATNSSPWGFATQAQADAIATQVNATQADLLNLKQLVNSLIDDRQADGLAQ